MRAAVLLLAALAALGCRGPALPYQLRPAATGPRYFATQEVVFKLPRGREEHLLTTVDNDGRRLAIAASSAMGQTLFVLTLADGALAVDARVPLPDSFDPRLLPTLIQLSDWPLAEARLGLAPGMELAEAGPVRTLSRRGRALLTLTREGPAPPWRRVILLCPAMGLEATITTLEDDAP